MKFNTEAYEAALAKGASFDQAFEEAMKDYRAQKQKEYEEAKAQAELTAKEEQRQIFIASAMNWLSMEMGDIMDENDYAEMKKELERATMAVRKTAAMTKKITFAPAASKDPLAIFLKNHGL